MASATLVLMDVGKINSSIGSPMGVLEGFSWAFQMLMNAVAVVKWELGEAARLDDAGVPPFLCHKSMASRSL